MPDVIRFSRVGEIGVVTLDNPPVNAFSLAQRAAFMSAFQSALDDPEIGALVINGEGRMFSAGADIREFDTGVSTQPPTLMDLIAAVEGSSKPVVVALHGNAVGGACELALGCHYRVAAPGTRIGLPEVTLGIVPGAGGTQRLPRLIGAEAALDVIVSGRPMDAARAHELGFLDAVVDGDLLDGAVAFAKRVLDEGGAASRTSEREDKIEEAREDLELFDRFRTKIARRARGFDAPFACIECVRAAVEKPFEEGLAFERATFVECQASLQSKAQRHVFFAEREARKVRGVEKSTPTLAVKRGVVLGCGTMGGGIAMCFANSGIPVATVESSQEALDRGMETIRKNYASTVSKGRLGREEADRRLGLIEPTLDFDSVADADVVIEAVFEEMDLKKDIFGRLDRLCRPEAIMATNTSTLDVNEIAAVTSRPEQVVGTHFFSPANVMRLVEIVRAEQTSPETLATTLKLSGQLGKVGVVVGVCDAFAANRMLYSYTRQAQFLIEEGAFPEQVDRVIYDFGFPMGPFGLGDLAGLDVGWRIRKRREPTRPKHLRHSTIADQICERGRYGQKTGAGWFRYEEGSRTPIPDPEVAEIIVAASEELGIERREISDEEILQRCMYPLVNEGAKILEEGIAQRASDLDVVWIYGFGFPRYRGGPMFYADSLGIGHVYEVLQDFSRTHHDWLEPASLLRSLASEDGSFGEWRAP